MERENVGVDCCAAALIGSTTNRAESAQRASRCLITISIDGRVFPAGAPIDSVYADICGVDGGLLGGDERDF